MMTKIFSSFLAVLALGSLSASAKSTNLRRNLGDCYKCNSNDPCDGGKEFYKHCKDDKYIQCGDGGTCFEMDCPAGLVWDQKKKKCEWPEDDGVMPAGKLDSCGGKYKCENPCTEKNIKKEKFYHEHCEKKKYYLQCGGVGQCFEKRCASGTKWDKNEGKEGGCVATN